MSICANNFVNGRRLFDGAPPKRQATMAMQKYSTNEREWKEAGERSLVGGLAPHPICGSILNLKSRGHALACLGWHPSCRVDTIDLADGASLSIFGRQLQPGNVLVRVGCGCGGILLASDSAPVVLVGLQVEEGCGAVGKVVVARHEEVGGRNAIRCGNGEAESDAREGGKKLGEWSGHAGGIKEGGYSSCGSGCGGCRRIGTGVVLGAAADDDVGKSEAGGWRVKGLWGCSCQHVFWEEMGVSLPSGIFALATLHESLGWSCLRLRSPMIGLRLWKRVVSSALSVGTT